MNSAVVKAAERHVVLVAPEIHWNTGNIGRTCLGVGARLHLVRPLGFSLDDKFVKRAGLDYWSQVNLSLWENWSEFAGGLAPEAHEIAVITKNGRRVFWEMPRPQRLFLVFGSETRGVPESILTPYADRSYHIPTMRHIRSLNLSTAVGIVLYESLKDTGFHHAWPSK